MIHMMQPVQAPAQTKHFPFDICNYQTCLEEAEYDEDIPKKKKGSQRSLKKRYKAGDPSIGLLGELAGMFEHYVLYGYSGATNQTTAAKATSSWQSENAVAQNNVLKTILAQQDNFTKTQKSLSQQDAKIGEYHI
ncbi:hypothetical protein L1987_32748 [Smallanthus sonchifolius]|uniref:Uncharacterized protein n=1 Tax=Smallanthus sonchifolius TaxID=185202 RepID=A0ACB9HQC4_9ASTR|nr:hypothetical protein L1987_32748 [Smallanthus sonchifolius]